MNSLMKIDVLLAFPMGAHIHSNLEVYVYRKLIQMIHRLSCICIHEKCISCSLKSSCHYYHLTGESFNAYPGILIRRDLFSKQIFKEYEECLLTFYMVGRCSVYKDYISIFFQEYLNGYLCGYPFVVKEISQETLENQEIQMQTCHVRTTVEDDDFQNLYNQMVIYYHEHYQCQYRLLEKPSVWLHKKRSKMQMVALNTKKVFPHGITGTVILDEKISSDLLQIGVGKYNYLGGGRIEN